jgi:hypothetical protein
MIRIRVAQDLENKILHMLANASGNILDDEELIETLGMLFRCNYVHNESHRLYSPPSL